MLHIFLFFFSFLYKSRLLTVDHDCRFIVHIYVYVCKMAEHVPCNPGLDINFFALPTDVLSFQTQASPCAVQECKIKYTQCHSYLSQRTQEATTLWKWAAFEVLQSPEREGVPTASLNSIVWTEELFFLWEAVCCFTATTVPTSIKILGAAKKWKSRTLCSELYREQ